MKIKFCKTGMIIILLMVCHKTYAQNANTSLSNLTDPTKVNVNLLPDKNAKHDLGSVTKTWNNIYFHNKWFKDSIQLFSSDIANFFFGNNAGQNNIGIYNTAIGINSLASVKSGQLNTAVGYYALAADSSGVENTAIGEEAMHKNKTGSDNTAVGSGALINNISGFVNTAIGAGALYANTTGSDNIATGYESLDQNLSGKRNIAIGNRSLFTNAIGLDNIAIGDHAMYNGNGGESDVAIGTNALYSTVSVYNTGVGYEVLKANTIGYRNSAFGNAALASNTTGTENTAIGDGAGSNVKTGSNNVFIGANANCGTTGAITNSTAIGSNVSIVTSNSFILGDANVNRWGFGVDAGSRALKVGSSASNGNGAYLSQGGVWTNTSAKNKKEDFQKQDKSTILQKINQLEITRWKYKGTENEYHYGPMADDFHRLFNVDDDSSIADMDKTGVLFLGMQQLIRLNTNKDSVINDLKTEIENLRSEINALKAMIVSNQSIVNSEQVTGITSASLDQNIPNPFSNSTTIGYYLPENHGNAYINFYAQDGTLLKSIRLSSKGKGILNLRASDLSSGVYHYALVIDGKIIDNKQMQQAK